AERSTPPFQRYRHRSRHRQEDGQPRYAAKHHGVQPWRTTILSLCCQIEALAISRSPRHRSAIELAIRSQNPTRERHPYVDVERVSESPAIGRAGHGGAGVNRSPHLQSVAVGNDLPPSVPSRLIEVGKPNLLQNQLGPDILIVSVLLHALATWGALERARTELLDEFLLGNAVDPDDLSVDAEDDASVDVVVASHHHVHINLRATNQEENQAGSGDEGIHHVTDLPIPRHWREYSHVSPKCGPPSLRRCFQLPACSIK